MAWRGIYTSGKKKTKYGANTAVVDGVKFDSKKEAARWCDLRLLERAGQIYDLRRQVKFVLIPEQRETNCADVYTKGPKKGCLKPGKLLERECSYIADFVYLDEHGNKVVEDTKGFRTPEYIIKRKLMLHVHGIRIKEV